MCGIAGFVSPGIDSGAARSLAGSMLHEIRNRGPDDSGIWVEDGVALGHLRLAIVDLSPSGHQPMISRDGRLVIVFNGEIYNYKQLRAQLEAGGHAFLGSSDTEVLLALIEKNGLHDALKQCIGMFALVVWDRVDRKLQLARDRFGEKPLYYSCNGGTLLFASELKAMAVHPAFDSTVDRSSLAELLRFGYVSAPHTIYAESRKLAPGRVLTLRVPAQSEAARSFDAWSPAETVYWSHEEVVLRGLKHRYAGSFEDASRELETLLRDAVCMQMNSDVPLGAFLSGGIDSSTVVALMQSLSEKPIRTFCIGFETARFDEAAHARAVAAHLGTAHTEHYVTARDALEVIPQLPSMFDEPLGDSSQIPTHLVAKLARTQVTVSLSGDGGDELFGGYASYAVGERLHRVRGRRAMGNVIGCLPWTGIEAAARVLPAQLRRKLTASRFRTLHRFLGGRPQEIAEAIAEHYHDADALVRGASPRSTAYSRERPPGIASSYQPLGMLLDREAYLPDDVLMKVDRATMAVSLESRAPLLDHRVAELSARMPMHFLAHDGQSKRLLRDVLYRLVPRTLVDRPKQGFSVPVAQWLRSDLRQWGHDLLASRKSEDLLDLPRCRQLFDAHVSGSRDLSAICWTMLSFLAWAEASL